jgi:cell fate (sporulation/competence/biofilm development) regulator YlbF (YheA/YmcA/DUF963 family)
MFEETLRRAALKKLKSQQKANSNLELAERKPSSVLDEEDDFSTVKKADTALDVLANDINKQISKAVKENKSEDVINKLVERYQRINKRR